MDRVRLTLDTLERSYLLHHPVGASSSPLLVFLHGTGGTADWADRETGWSRFAAKHGLALVVPEGLPPFLDKPAKFLTNPQRWNDGSTRPGDPFHSEADDVAFLETVIRDALDRTGADRRRVFLTGFSNGAGMVFRFAAERSEMLAGIAPVAGHCWVPNPRLVKPVPTLYILGTNDPLIPMRGGSVKSPWTGRLVRRPSVVETLETWATALGCDPVSQLLREEGGVREERFPGPVEYRGLFVEGLGHHWPGGEGKFNPRIGGTPTDRVKANDVVWQFFQSLTTW